MKASRPVVASAGVSSGRNTRIRTVHGPAPSITAASSNSFGSARMKVVSVQMVNGKVRIMSDRIRPVRVLYRPIARISSNRPDSTATCGNIDTPRMVSSSRRRPLKSMRPNANAAEADTASEISTTLPATTTEFMMSSANGCPVKASW